MTMGQDESNWFLQIAEDHVPVAASELGAATRVPEFSCRKARIDHLR
jgi:hypothetical protein